MAEADPAASAASPGDAPFDAGLAIASLRAEAADRLDPVRFHFIETLARRALPQQGEVRRVLDRKLSDALAAYRERFTPAQNDAKALIGRVTAQHPQAADALQQLFVDGDFSGLRRFAAGLQKVSPGGPLADLVRHAAQHPPDGGVAGTGASGSPAELKTARNFRATWSRLSVDKQLSQAIGQGPENAGPINSHMLVLRSLTLMRDLSPDYLHRFMSYADTLLWLDQAGKKDKPTMKTTRAAKTKKQ